MIEVKELVKKYGQKTVLDHVSFEVGEGEILGLLGPNGAGKSTTMNIISGNLSATAGAALIDGHDILEEPLRAKKELGYLPEIPPLYQDMTVEAYLRFVYRLKKCALPRAEHLDKICRDVRLNDVRGRVIKNLSKGYRQRIGIAQALIGDPKVLILDEPTVGLDPKQMVEVRQLVRRLGEKHTVILSSHILAEVQAVCDRVVVINQGKVIASGAPEKLSEALSGGALRVRVEGPQVQVQAMLKAVPGVTKVRTIESADASCCAFEVRTDGRAGVKRKIALCLKESAWLLVGMESAEMSLENVFLKLTTGKEE